jgi:hypothetical protein
VLDDSVSLRRVALALSALPPGTWPDSDHVASWSITEHLLAVLIDEVRQLTWLTARAAGAKHVARPEPMQRPGARRRSKASDSAGDGKVSWSDFTRSMMALEGSRG